MEQKQQFSLEQNIDSKEQIQDLEKQKNLTVVCISDTHRRHDKMNIPKGDILIHSGDFTLQGGENEIESFITFLQKQPHKYKIIIAGNHDISLDLKNFEKLNQDFYQGKYQADPKNLIQKLKENCIYLENESIEILGYNFYGSPYSLEFHNWAFMYNESEAQFLWDQIPDNTDILITHGPPFEIQDKTQNGQNVGCKYLRDTVLNRVKPIYHIFGHIHEDYGQQKIEKTTFINASSLNFKYKVTNKPVQFKLLNKFYQKQSQNK